MIDPSYLRVAEPDRELSLTAARHSDRRQLVRVWAAEYPSKMSKISEFTEIELQPADGQLLTRNFPSLNRSYWLAIAVFSNDRTQWLRSRTTRPGPFAMPQTDWGFFDADAAADMHRGHPNIILGIDYV